MINSPQKTDQQHSWLSLISLADVENENCIRKIKQKTMQFDIIYFEIQVTTHIQTIMFIYVLLLLLLLLFLLVILHVKDWSAFLFLIATTDVLKKMDVFSRKKILILIGLEKMFISKMDWKPAGLFSSHLLSVCMTQFISQGKKFPSGTGQSTVLPPTC